jgi:hypothetical protein
MKKISPSLLEHPEKHIPNGSYCYGENGKCPFWDIDESKPSQENGYCHYLKKGDWDFNSEGGTITDMKTGETFHIEHNPFNGLLWDQVKECGINDDDYE